MKIQRLFLRNVRNVKDLDLDFRDPFTQKPMSRIVLVGANGSGKTTILESLFASLASFESGGILLIGEKALSTNITITEDTQIQILFELTSDKEKNSTFVFSHGLSELIEKGNFQSSTHIIDKILSSKQNQSSILYFPSNRYLPQLEKGQLNLEPQTYQWAYRYQANDEWKGSTESFLFSQNYLDLEDRDRGQLSNRFNQTIQIVNSILNEKRIARIEKGRAVVETNKGESHGLSDLSSGEKQLVLLLVEIIRHIVPGSVILIDEPEISLHPAWQRGLMAALNKVVEQYDAQIILATHSLEIATSVMPHEVISLNDLGLPLGKWDPTKEALPA